MYLLDSLRWLAGTVGQWAWRVLTGWILPPSWVEAMGPDRTPADGSWSMAAVLDAEGEAIPPGGTFTFANGGMVSFQPSGNALDVFWPVEGVHLPTLHEIRQRYGSSND